MGYDTYDTRLKRTLALLLLICAIAITFRAGQISTYKPTTCPTEVNR